MACSQLPIPTTLRHRTWPVSSCSGRSTWRSQNQAHQQPLCSKWTLTCKDIFLPDWIEFANKQKISTLINSSNSKLLLLMLWTTSKLEFMLIQGVLQIKSHCSRVELLVLKAMCRLSFLIWHKTMGIKLIPHRKHKFLTAHWKCSLNKQSIVLSGVEMYSAKCSLWIQKLFRK